MNTGKFKILKINSVNNTKALPDIKYPEKLHRLGDRIPIGKTAYLFSWNHLSLTNIFMKNVVFLLMTVIAISLETVAQTGFGITTTHPNAYI